MHKQDCFPLCSLSKVSLSRYNNVICLNTKNNVFNLAHMCKFYFCYTSRGLSVFSDFFKVNGKQSKNYIDRTEVPSR